MMANPFLLILQIIYIYYHKLGKLAFESFGMLPRIEGAPNRYQNVIATVTVHNLSTSTLMELALQMVFLEYTKTQEITATVTEFSPRETKALALFHQGEQYENVLVDVSPILCRLLKELWYHSGYGQFIVFVAVVGLLALAAAACKVLHAGLVFVYNKPWRQSARPKEIRELNSEPETKPQHEAVIKAEPGSQRSTTELANPFPSVHRIGSKRRRTRGRRRSASVPQVTGGKIPRFQEPTTYPDDSDSATNDGRPQNVVPWPENYDAECREVANKLEEHRKALESVPSCGTRHHRYRHDVTKKECELNRLKDRWRRFKNDARPARKRGNDFSSFVEDFVYLRQDVLDFDPRNVDTCDQNCQQDTELLRRFTPQNLTLIPWSPDKESLEAETSLDVIQDGTENDEQAINLDTPLPQPSERHSDEQTIEAPTSVPQPSAEATGERTADSTTPGPQSSEKLSDDQTADSQASVLQRSTEATGKQTANSITPVSPLSEEPSGEPAEGPNKSVAQPSTKIDDEPVDDLNNPVPQPSPNARDELGGDLGTAVLEPSAKPNDEDAEGSTTPAVQPSATSSHEQAGDSNTAVSQSPTTPNEEPAKKSESPSATPSDDCSKNPPEDAPQQEPRPTSNNLDVFGLSALKFFADFPNWYDRIPTSPLQLLCGLDAIEKSFEAQHGSPNPTKAELKAIVEDPDWREWELNVHGKVVKNFFEIDQLDGILQWWLRGRDPLRPIRLGSFTHTENKPFIFAGRDAPLPPEAYMGAAIVWIYHDGHAHWEGLRPRPTSSLPDLPPTVVSGQHNDPALQPSGPSPSSSTVDLSTPTPSVVVQQETTERPGYDANEIGRSMRTTSAQEHDLTLANSAHVSPVEKPQIEAVEQQPLSQANAEQPAERAPRQPAEVPSPTEQAPVNEVQTFEPAVPSAESTVIEPYGDEGDNGATAVQGGPMEYSPGKHSSPKLTPMPSRLATPEQGSPYYMELEPTVSGPTIPGLTIPDPVFPPQPSPSLDPKEGTEQTGQQLELVNESVSVSNTMEGIEETQTSTVGRDEPAQEYEGMEGTELTNALPIADLRQTPHIEDLPLPEGMSTGDQAHAHDESTGEMQVDPDLPPPHNDTQEPIPHSDWEGEVMVKQQAGSPGLIISPEVQRVLQGLNSTNSKGFDPFASGTFNPFGSARQLGSQSSPTYAPSQTPSHDLVTTSANQMHRVSYPPPPGQELQQHQPVNPAAFRPPHQPNYGPSTSVASLAPKPPSNTNFQNVPVNPKALPHSSSSITSPIYNPGLNLSPLNTSQQSPSVTKPYDNPADELSSDSTLTDPPSDSDGWEYSPPPSPTFPDSPDEPSETIPGLSPVEDFCANPDCRAVLDDDNYIEINDSHLHLGHCDPWYGWKLCEKCGKFLLGPLKRVRNEIDVKAAADLEQEIQKKEREKQDEKERREEEEADTDIEDDDKKDDSKAGQPQDKCCANPSCQAAFPVNANTGDLVCDKIKVGGISYVVCRSCCVFYKSNERLPDWEEVEENRKKKERRARGKK